MNKNRPLLHTNLLINEQTVNKALSKFIALLLHEFDNDYCQKVSGGLRVYQYHQTSWLHSNIIRSRFLMKNIVTAPSLGLNQLNFQTFYC